MEWVLTEVIPALVKEGIFGDVDYVDLKPEDVKDIGAHFASSLAFVNLIVNGTSGEEVYPLVVKTKMEGRDNDSLIQFQMEELMYQKVLPTLRFDQDWYPKLYSANVSNSNHKENYLIFENLKYRNFRNIDSSSIFIDFDHISLALKKIAKLHSLSYTLRHEDNDKFSELIEKLNRYSYYAGEGSTFNAPIFASIERGIRAFEKKNHHEELMENFLAALKYPDQLKDELAKPEEPFGAIIHGDFCCNNIMYKYGPEGRPIDCAFFDFQLSKYGSISTDLAFYLYMHTDSDSRRKHWDEYIKIYWKALRENVPDNIELPSYEDFLGHFARRAVYGYTICCFYVPMMMDNIVYWGNWALEDQIELNQTMAGEKGEEKIVDIISHLYTKKYIHAFMDYTRANKIVR